MAPKLTIHTISEVLVGALQNIREVPALMALVALLVHLDVSSRRAKDILVLFEGRLGVGSGVRATTAHSRVTSFEVHRISHFTICMCSAFSKRGHFDVVFACPKYVLDKYSMLVVSY
jgi:hypothetical protein